MGYEPVVLFSPFGELPAEQLLVELAYTGRVARGYFEMNESVKFGLRSSRSCCCFHITRLAVAAMLLLNMPSTREIDRMKTAIDSSYSFYKFRFLIFGWRTSNSMLQAGRGDRLLANLRVGTPQDHSCSQRNGCYREHLGSLSFASPLLDSSVSVDYFLAFFGGNLPVESSDRNRHRRMVSGLFCQVLGMITYSFIGFPFIGSRYDAPFSSRSS